MTTTDDGPLRETTRKTPAQPVGSSAHASAVAEAAYATWHEVTVRLAPVIGPRGVHALFSRSLHITRRSFPWLEVDGQSENSAALFASLKTCLASSETDAAKEASSVLLMTFTELLKTLIGESLTVRLLNPVNQVRPLPVSKQENAS